MFELRWIETNDFTVKWWEMHKLKLSGLSFRHCLISLKFQRKKETEASGFINSMKPTLRKYLIYPPLFSVAFHNKIMDYKLIKHIVWRSPNSCPSLPAILNPMNPLRGWFHGVTNPIFLTKPDPNEHTGFWNQFRFWSYCKGRGPLLALYSAGILKFTW